MAIAIKVFDLAVNLGDRAAVLCLQRALRACGIRVTVDGRLGPETCGAVRRAAGEYRLRLERGASQAAFGSGWMNRAYA